LTSFKNLDIIDIMKHFFVWPEDKFREIEKEYEQKWRDSRHEYYSPQKLNEILLKEENDERKCTIQSKSN
jgi:hypothetical protein